MNTQEIENKYMAPTYGRRDITIVKGDGAILFDDNGKEYIDCFSNVGVNILGHNVPELNDAVYSQMQKITNLHCSFYNDTRAEFSKALIEVCPDKLTKVFFCNSGTESIEAAIKFARLASGKKHFLSAKMGYHGKTMGALSLTTTNPKYRESFSPLLENVSHYSFNDINSVKESITDDTAAIFIEPIQGESGIRPADKTFMKELRALCDEKNIFLVADEVQSGMGRTGKMFAIEHYGINPDIMCLAKGIAGGVPMGATIATEAVASKMFSGCHTNTFGGNPLACAAGITTLNYIKNRKLLENASVVGEYFIEQLKSIDSNLIREVRGIGLMIGVEFKTRAVPYIKALQDEGVLVFPSGNLVIRFLPPLVFTKKQVDEVIVKFKKILV
ncbi:MAG: aspartate aminotransferase family protein [archaeon]